MQDILKKIENIISENIKDVDVSKLHADESLIDQGLDSLVRTDILISIGEVFDVELVDIDESIVASLNKIASFIKEQKGESLERELPKEFKSPKSVLNRESLVVGLKKIGVKAGDVLLVHSDLFSLGQLEYKSADENLDLIYNSFMEVLGTSGTLLVPAYYYEYGRWENPYDIKRSETSKELGAFSKFVTRKSESKRSLHPLTALAGSGKLAEYITSGECGTSYGVDSAWDRFYESDGKMLFLGVDLRSMTFIHYVEHRVGVPHIYNKLHSTPVFRDGEEVKIPICSSVRFLDFDIAYNKYKFTEMFKKAGLVNEYEIGTSVSYFVKSREIFKFLVKELNKDFYYLLKNKPNFRQNQIPMDGKAGAARE